MLRGFVFLLSCWGYLQAQGPAVSGWVGDARSRKPLPGVVATLQASGVSGATDATGRFSLELPLPADSLYLSLHLPGYLEMRFGLGIPEGPLDLGVIWLEQDPQQEAGEAPVTLTDADLFEEEALSMGSVFLQAGRDLFLNRAAFDFSAAFFRVRGFDNREGAVFFNGVPMNRFYDGRPQWNNWGGLNDVTRYPEFRMGLQVGGAGFGGLLGTTLLEVGPESLREGFRLTSSASNRGYRGRLMATFNSGIGKQGWGYLVSASGRLAGSGYMEGTSYEAISALASIGFHPSEAHAFTLTGVYASNLRGRSSALTLEALELGGRAYNPYWGWQDGKVRNSRMRYIGEPFLTFSYRYRGKKLHTTLAAGYQWGLQYRTRLGYFNAPNPDPSYYRNLPSFYWNSPIGPNLFNAREARDGFLEHRQVDWGRLYQANLNTAATGTAAYLLLSDRSEERQFSLNQFATWEPARGWKLGGGFLYQGSVARNYARLDDLLGAATHLDIDPFSQTRNDLEGSPEKKQGDRIGYDYGIRAGRWDSFASLEVDFGWVTAFTAVGLGGVRYQREGFFRNARYPDHSAGPGETLHFPERRVKAGLNLGLTGRHWLGVQAAMLSRAPLLRDLFVNPRDQGGVVPGVRNERATTADLTYFYRGHALSSRLSAYYARFSEGAQVSFFFSDTGLGSGFVQEVATGVGKASRGVEWGLEYEAGPSVQLSAALAYADHRYAANPEVTLFFLPGTQPGELVQEEGRLPLGPADLKGKPFAAGPSTAVSLGLNYRAPAFWWAGVTGNYMAGQYTSLSMLRHTASFLLDPETGQAVSGISREAVEGLLAPRPLPPIYLLNLTAGKSWKKGTHYISLFASVSNLFDAFFLSGGYEQGRNGNYLQWSDDRLSGSPSFGPKFWPGFGRTYFMNLSWSF
jgi:hypothetical protein